MMKDKVKDFMKKVTFSSSSSSSSAFKGPSHVLGSSPSTSSSRPSNPNPNPNPNPTPRPQQQPPPSTTRPSDFTPFSALISSASSSSSRGGGGGGNAVACPNCAVSFPSEAAVNDHLDECLAGAGGARSRAAAYLSGKPPAAAVEVVRKLLANLLNEPGNEKYRRIRLANPRIKEAVADMEGGVALLEAVGFQIVEEGGELFAVMGVVPEEARLVGIRQAVLLLERSRPSPPPQPQGEADAKESGGNGAKEGEPKAIDRQIRIFFSVPGNSTAENDLPDSFYNLTNEEIRNEAKMRRESLEKSRLLIPKSYKEKQALAARQKYKQTVIRVQFPDGVILQGVFLPSEATVSLYEFVASALKQPSLEFELLFQALPKSHVVPHFPNPGERARTLQEEQLVPSALLKFKPKETDSVVFIGLLDKLLQASEPLISSSSSTVDST